MTTGVTRKGFLAGLSDSLLVVSGARADDNEITQDMAFNDPDFPTSMIIIEVFAPCYATASAVGPNDQGRHRVTVSQSRKCARPASETLHKMRHREEGSFWRKADVGVYILDLYNSCWLDLAETCR